MVVNTHEFLYIKQLEVIKMKTNGAITKIFKDALIIGYQNCPNFFILNIILFSILY